MKRSRQSILTSERMKAAAERRAEAERARRPVADLPLFAEGGLQALRIDLSDLEAILAFVESSDAEERWFAAKGSRRGWEALREYAATARTLLE